TLRVLAREYRVGLTSHKPMEKPDANSCKLGRIGCIERGAEDPWILLRRVDDLLRLHASGGHGQRPSGELLPLRRGVAAPLTVDCRGAVPISHSSSLADAGDLRAGDPSLAADAGDVRPSPEGADRVGCRRMEPTDSEGAAGQRSGLAHLVDETGRDRICPIVARDGTLRGSGLHGSKRR